MTPALKEYEEKVLTAAERIETRERELFDALRAAAGREIARLQRIARAVAELDVLSTFADVAAREGYVASDDDGRLRLSTSRRDAIRSSSA